MNGEAPMPPSSRCAAGGLGVQEKPRQFQERWLEAMQPLPSQVLRPLRDALKIHRRPEFRLRKLDAARDALNTIKSNAGIYSDSVDARLERLRAGEADPANPLQARAFMARLGDSGLTAMEKRRRMESAIAYAEMTMDWLAWELAHGD